MLKLFYKLQKVLLCLIIAVSLFIHTLYFTLNINISLITEYTVQIRGRDELIGVTKISVYSEMSDIGFLLFFRYYRIKLYHIAAVNSKLCACGIFWVITSKIPDRICYILKIRNVAERCIIRQCASAIIIIAFPTVFFIIPGSTAFTRILYLPKSSASALIIPSAPDFDALYAILSGIAR